MCVWNMGVHVLGPSIYVCILSRYSVSSDFPVIIDQKSRGYEPL